MKKLSALLICACMLVACGDNSISHDYIEKKKYDIENAVDGKYTVVYTQTSAIPDDRIDIKIKKDDDVIFTFRTDAKGQYKLPEKVAYLFDYDGEKVYYVQNYKQENSGITESEPSCWISRSSDNDCVSTDINSEYEELRKTSEFLRENITEQEIMDIFGKCGYDDTYILEMYRFKE